MESLDIEMDTEWMKDASEMNNYYREKNDIVQSRHIFMDGSGNIVRVHKDTIVLSTPNFLSKEECIRIITNMMQRETRYRLFSLLQYSFSLYEEDIISQDNNNNDKNMLTIHHSIDDIVWSDTIHCMKDLNEIFFIYQERKSIQREKMDNASDSRTKKIRIRAANGTHGKTRRRRH